ncbi:MAG: PLP-dependent aspartate aminotransferase family protein [Salinibacter sp.]|uniref:trans-sulfuration enzyme family protein n=1 Tax=Salinibacter sp. TaxID=2065818 RepID=UPI0035D5292D
MFDTDAVHAGEPDPPIERAVTLPIFQTATYTNEPQDGAVRYVRYNNSPNHEALHEKLAALTHTEDALVTASGMAAISSALLTLLDAGDHLVVPRSLYGGTLTLLGDLLPQFDIEHSFLPDDGPATWAGVVRPETEVLYAESITNPLLSIPDLEAMVAFAEAHDLVAVIDNTFASPVNLRPAKLGFDVVVHSATKYLGGHSDLAGGVVAGPSDLLDGARKTVKLLGGSLDPHACFLLHRSLKTLGVRVRKQNRTAHTIAEALVQHDAVDQVHYPGLSSHPDHDRACALFDECGAMVSFELSPASTPDDFFEALSLPLRAPSLGGVETLITQPRYTSHKDVPSALREKLGITERFVRLSVGLEGPDDLVEDLTTALDHSLDA